MSYNPLIHAAELIESVVAQKLTAEAALRIWPYALNQKYLILAKSWTRLRHYADDKDLHESDMPYFASEQEQLKLCVVELRKEAARLDNFDQTATQ